MSWDQVVIAIPTMPQRRALLAELVERVESECPGAEIVTREHEPDTPPRVDFPAVIDRALETRRPWILQLEDDVVLAPDFGRLALPAVAEADARRADAVSLFSRSRRDVEMFHRGERWRTQAPSSFCMMQAVFLRASAMVGFSAWTPRWYGANPEHVHAADLLLGAWLSERRSRMLVHVPSLVQHRRVPSTLPNHRGDRRSETFRLAFGEAP